MGALVLLLNVRYIISVKLQYIYISPANTDLRLRVSDVPIG